MINMGSFYRTMINDKSRIQLFKKAIESVVKQGDVVVDIGTGLGTYALFAARAGARKVYAVEKTRIIYLAEQICRANDLHRQVEFIEGNVTDTRLNEKADVIIFEDFGPFITRRGLDEILVAANQRLKPDGVIIPKEMRLYIAPVESSEVYDEIDTFQDTDDALYDIDFSATRELVMNEIHYATVTPEMLFAPPQELHRYALKGKPKLTCDCELTFTANRAGILHGITGWFDAVLAEGIVMSNAPETGIESWGQVFFPLTDPLPIEKDAEIYVSFLCVESEKNGSFWWTWAVATDEAVIEGSTFRSIPISIPNRSGRSSTARAHLVEQWS